MTVTRTQKVLNKKEGFWNFDKKLDNFYAVFSLEIENARAHLTFTANHMSRKNLVLQF